MAASYSSKLADGMGVKGLLASLAQCKVTDEQDHHMVAVGSYQFVSKCRTCVKFRFRSV